MKIVRLYFTLFIESKAYLNEEIEWNIFRYYEAPLTNAFGYVKTHLWNIESQVLHLYVLNEINFIEPLYLIVRFCCRHKIDNNLKWFSTQSVEN